MALSGIKTFLDPFKVEYLESWFNIWAPVFKIVLHSVAMASMALFSCYRWETVPLWLGWLWVEICPLRWTDQALPQTHRAPPLPVPEVRPSVLQVGPPRLTHEEALLSPQTVDVTHTARREFSIFYLSHCLPGQGRSSTGKHYNHGQVPNKSTCEWIIRRQKEAKRQIKEQMGSVTGSSIIPILNPTWIFLDLQMPMGWLEAGYQGIN